MMKEARSEKIKRKKSKFEKRRSFVKHRNLRIRFVEIAAFRAGVGVPVVVIAAAAFPPADPGSEAVKIVGEEEEEVVMFGEKVVEVVVVVVTGLFPLKTTAGAPLP